MCLWQEDTNCVISLEITDLAVESESSSSRSYELYQRLLRPLVHSKVSVSHRPPSSSMSNGFLEDLGRCDSPNEVIICGDFKVHYANAQSTAASNLADLLDNTSFVQHVSNSTHVNGNSLELGITARDSMLIASPVASTTLVADHHTVECDMHIDSPAPLQCWVRYRKYASIEKRTFASDIREAFATSRTTGDLIDT